MCAQYLSVRAGQRGGMLELRVAGELDMITAPRFEVQVSGKLEKQSDRYVIMDLSGVGFMDCAGARTLKDVLTAIPAGHLADLRGVQPQVGRVLDLVGVVLPSSPPRDELPSSSRARAALAQAYTAQAESRQILEQASRIMTQLAITCSEMAAAAQRRAGIAASGMLAIEQHYRVEGQEQAQALRLEQMSDTARELSIRCRQLS